MIYPAYPERKNSATIINPAISSSGSSRLKLDSPLPLEQVSVRFTMKRWWCTSRCLPSILLCPPPPLFDWVQVILMFTWPVPCEGSATLTVSLVRDSSSNLSIIATVALSFDPHVLENYKPIPTQPGDRGYGSYAGFILLRKRDESIVFMAHV
ncbi:hypothetical protein ACGC1H_005754 [Rhizoctonia solani]